MSRIGDLAFRYLHRALAVSKGTPTQYTASSGTVLTAVSAAAMEATGYWNGAIVRWDVGGNAGLYSSVLSFDGPTHTLTFDEELPVAVASGDKFTLFLGGLYASSESIPGLKTSDPVNVTGFSFAYAAMLNGEGTGVLRFAFSGLTLTWTPPGESEGMAVSVSGLSVGDSATLSGGGTSIEQTSKFLRVTRTPDALPVADQEDDVNLTMPAGSFLATFTGAEAEAGVTVYRAVGIENTGGSGLQALKAYCPSPWPDAAETTIAAGGSIGTGADTLVAESLLDWGSHGFVFNSTKNDVRYFFDRSGETASILDPAGGVRGFTAVAWDVGDVLEPLPWFDIGLDAPAGGGAFEDPASETTAPSGVAFSCPRTVAAGLAIGDLAAGAIYTIWERFFVPAGFRTLEAGRVDLRVYAEATE